VKETPLRQLTSFLDTKLSITDFPDDESSNGLQVEGRDRIKRIGVAVDACEYVFRKAVAEKVDLLFVHHGIIWGGIKAVRGVVRKRIGMLLAADISLYVCHLPLDWHPELGNNAQILKLLSLKKMGAFGEYHDKQIGYWAIPFSGHVKNVGIVSGGGWSAIHDAERYGIDTLLTGESSHSAYTLAEDMKINLIYAGHYATETPGVQAVGRLLKKKFGFVVSFIDHPTGL
jgi:putative NIF3 family GTP cyclohydrolase 1 type 2